VRNLRGDDTSWYLMDDDRVPRLIGSDIDNFDANAIYAANSSKPKKQKTVKKKQKETAPYIIAYICSKN
jgi:hypothetical protein